MKTFLLAAGQSSRMAPLVDKNFMEFSGMPLVIRIAYNAYLAGIRDFGFVINAEQKPKLEAIIPQYNWLQGAEVLIQDDFDRGQAGAVEEILKVTKDDEALLILNGNDYVDRSIFTEILNLEDTWGGGLVCKRMENYFPGGYIKVDDKNKIQSIIEKPGAGNEPSDLVNIVIHFFRKAGTFRSALTETAQKQDDDYEVALDRLFKTQSFCALPYEGSWGALKYPWHTLDMMTKLFEMQVDVVTDKFVEIQPQVWVHKTAQIAETAVFRGENIVVDAEARIFDHAVIAGPAYIGQRAVVGDQALVRESNLGSSSVAGYNTEIARSWIGQNTTTHLAYIGDSVVGDEVNFGAQSTTANLRLDKKTVKMTVKDQRIDTGCDKLGAIIGNGAQIGIHAMLMPGCKIEAGQLVGPGEVVK